EGDHIRQRAHYVDIIFGPQTRRESGLNAAAPAKLSRRAASTKKRFMTPEAIPDLLFRQLQAGHRIVTRQLKGR
ncbi:hypothetical protein NL437_26475, partial [Klebsiella pneumoniae]|nr:hypothetical protein [Klebsiella pneumoniae]